MNFRVVSEKGGVRDGENAVHTLGRSATEVFSSFRPRGGRGRQAESAVIRQGRCNDPEMVIPWKVPERMPNPKVTLTLSRASSVASVSIIQRRGSYNHLMALDFNIPLSLFPPSPPLHLPGGRAANQKKVAALLLMHRYRWRYRWK